MRFLRFCFVIILSVMLLSFAASAEETVNFNEVDWSTVDMRTIDPDAFCDWIHSDASLGVLFELVFKADGEKSECLSQELWARLEHNPQIMLMALSNQEAAVRNQAYSMIVYSGDYKQAEFIAFLESVTLAGPDAAAGYEVLAELIDHAQLKFGMEITNPKTGDGVMIVALLMSFSISGAAILQRKKMTDQK